MKKINNLDIQITFNSGEWTSYSSVSFTNSSFSEVKNEVLSLLSDVLWGYEYEKENT